MVASRRWVAVLVGVALAAGGCAEGVPGAAPGADDGDDDGGDEDGGDDRPDAGERPDADEGDDDGDPAPDAGAPDAAPPPDAAPRTVTLSQNNAETVTTGAVVCVGGLLFPYLRENSWYRAFRLADHGVDGGFAVSRVDFSVYTATSGSFSGVQPLKVRLHTLSGSVLTTAALTQIASADLEVDDGGQRAVSVPITAAVPAGATLVAEVLAPDAVSTGHLLQLGANTAGERGPGYWRGPGCVTGVQAIHDAAQAHEIVLTVTGSAE